MSGKYLTKEIGEPTQNWIKGTATGYSPGDPAQGTTDGITYTGFDLNKPRVDKLPIIAVNPDLEFEMYDVVEIKDVGGFIVLDIGGGVECIDIQFSTKQEALDWGRKDIYYRILERSER